MPVSQSDFRLSNLHVIEAMFIEPELVDSSDRGRRFCVFRPPARQSPLLGKSFVDLVGRYFNPDAMQDVRHALLFFLAFVATLCLPHHFLDALSCIFIPAWALFCLFLASVIQHPKRPSAKSRSAANLPILNSCDSVLACDSVLQNSRWKSWPNKKPNISHAS